VRSPFISSYGSRAPVPVVLQHHSDITFRHILYDSLWPMYVSSRYQFPMHVPDYRRNTVGEFCSRLHCVWHRRWPTTHHCSLGLLGKSDIYLGGPASDTLVRCRFLSGISASSVRV
jgi:hypothetical protein